MFYSSKLKEYKSIFGAIKQEQEICYRVFAPYALAVNMLIRKGENTPFECYPMSTNNDGWFENKTSFHDVGVYFYHFEIVYDRHKQSIFRSDDMSDCLLGGF